MNIKTANVSVVIPCFNSLKTLERAVESVFNQTLCPNELILVDDGSTDKTVELMYNLKGKYSNFSIIIIELGADLGVSTARNSGWDKSTQNYIAFLDSDDSWHKDKINIQYNFMEINKNIVMTGTNFNIILSDNENTVVYDERYEVISWTGDELLWKNHFVTPGVMIRSNIKERFQNGRSDMDDHLLWLEIAFNYGVVSMINLPLVFLHKPQWGNEGLASNLWAMEKGELKNYQYLLSTGRISIFKFLFFNIFSIMKFNRRLFIKYILKGTSS